MQKIGAMGRLYGVSGDAEAGQTHAIKSGKRSISEMASGVGMVCKVVGGGDML
uniref:Uncharacterized protein n=1 Tax=Peronospora matthiolae TaxID=2874970 RepID=A0AAV1UZE4_9STRA